MTYLSHSQVNMLLKCPRQYEFRYVKGIRLPSNHMLTLGSAYHKGLETNFRQKVVTEVDLPLSDVQDAFSDEWERRLKWGDVEFVEDAKPGEVKDNGVRIISQYHEEISPSVQPFLVEEPFTIQAGKVELRGIIDLATTDSLVDHKTASRAWTQNKADSDLQATCYLMVAEELGLPIHSFEFHVATPEPKVSRMKTQRSKQEIAWYQRVLEQVSGVVKSGVFVPALPGSWYCEKKWCGYFSMCKPWMRD